MLTHANLTRSVLDEGGRQVTHLVAAFTGRQTTYRTRRSYVLATGGLETARLLLANRDRHAAGHWQ